MEIIVSNEEYLLVSHSRLKKVFFFLIIHSINIYSAPTEYKGYEDSKKTTWFNK